MNKIIKEIVIASHNEGKVKEIKSLLGPMGFKIYSAKKFNINEPAENGKTFGENSIIKSKNTALKSGLPAIADDSGLCILSLDNQPGIYSARWAGKSKNFNIAMNKIEKKMSRSRLFNKSARKAFFAALCLFIFQTITIEYSKAKSTDMFSSPHLVKMVLDMIQYLFQAVIKKHLEKCNFPIKKKLAIGLLRLKNYQNTLRNLDNLT